MSDPLGFAGAYRAALEKYVDTGREVQLEEAYSLGRQAVADGMTILELVAHHRGAVEQLARRPGASPDAAAVGTTFEFLAEALSTFEMAQRGYWEAQERARLEREQSEMRERLTQAYLAVDRALELPDRLAAIEAAAMELVGAAGAQCRLVPTADADDEASPGDPDPDPGPDAGPARDPGAGPDDPDPGPDGLLSGDLTFAIRDPAGEAVATLVLDTGNRPPLSDDERFLLGSFSHMVGVAVENARQFARERSIALMLQHDLLPTSVPAVPGLDLAVRYLPGEATSHAGGDLYDIVELGDGRVGLVIGDVTGHGVSAAAAMGQLRMAVLAYALAGFGPADVVERIDTLLDTLGGDRIATLVYAIAEPGPGRLTVANAGHPPPILVRPDGTSHLVSAGHGLLLGIDQGTGRDDEEIAVPPGSHLLLYTDGLLEPLERRGVDGIDRLLEVTERFTGTASDLCDRALTELAPHQASDDICILAATFIPP